MKPLKGKMLAEVTEKALNQLKLEKVVAKRNAVTVAVRALAADIKAQKGHVKRAKKDLAHSLKHLAKFKRKLKKAQAGEGIKLSENAGPWATPRNFMAAHELMHAYLGQGTGMGKSQIARDVLNERYGKTKDFGL